MEYITSWNKKEKMRKKVLKSVPNDEIKKLLQQTYSLNDTQKMVDSIIAYQKQLSLIPIEKLDNDNKNWLSTYEYSESILANKNLEEKDAQREFAYTIAVLYEFIQKNNQ